MESLTQPTDGPTMRAESPGPSEIEELELSDLLSPPALDWAGASEKARRWWGRNMRMMRLRRIPSAQRVYQKAKAAKRACRRAASALTGQSESYRSLLAAIADGATPPIQMELDTVSSGLPGAPADGAATGVAAIEHAVSAVMTSAQAQLRAALARAEEAEAHARATESANNQLQTALDTEAAEKRDLEARNAALTSELGVQSTPTLSCAPSWASQPVRA